MLLRGARSSPIPLGGKGGGGHVVVWLDRCARGARDRLVGDRQHLWPQNISLLDHAVDRGIRGCERVTGLFGEARAMARSAWAGAASTIAAPDPPAEISHEFRRPNPDLRSPR